MDVTWVSSAMSPRGVAGRVSYRSARLLSGREAWARSSHPADPRPATSKTATHGDAGESSSGRLPYAVFGSAEANAVAVGVGVAAGAATTESTPVSVHSGYATGCALA